MKKRNVAKALQHMKLREGSDRDYIRTLILDGELNIPITSNQLCERINERFSRTVPLTSIPALVRPFFRKGYIRSKFVLVKRRKKIRLLYAGWVSDLEAEKFIADVIGKHIIDVTIRETLKLVHWSALPPVVRKNIELAQKCFVNRLWEPAVVMCRRSYETALVLKYKEIEKKNPEKEPSCPKCSYKLGRRPMNITELHEWAVKNQFVREKLTGMGIVIKDIGAGGAHPIEYGVVDKSIAEVAFKCTVILVNDIFRRG